MSDESSKPAIFPVDAAMEERIRRETRYIEFTDRDNLKTKLLLDKDCTRVVFAERETPDATWDVDPNFQSIVPFLQELQRTLTMLLANAR